MATGHHNPDRVPDHRSLRNVPAQNGYPQRQCRCAAPGAIPPKADYQLKASYSTVELALPLLCWEYRVMRRFSPFRPTWVAQVGRQRSGETRHAASELDRWLELQ